MGYDMMRTLLRLGRQKIKYEPWKDNNQDSDTTNLSLFASVSDKFVVLGFRCVDVEGYWFCWQLHFKCYRIKQSGIKATYFYCQSL